MGIDAEILYTFQAGEKHGRDRDWGERIYLIETEAGLVAVQRCVTKAKKDFLLAGKKRWSDVDTIEEFYVHERLGTVGARVKIGKQRHAVVDDVKGPGFDSIDEFCFTRAGEACWVATTKKKGTTIARGKTTWGPFEYATNLIPTVDGKQCAFIVAEGGKRGKYGGMAGGKWTVMVDGEKRSEAFDHITFVTWTDGGKLAFIGNVGGTTDGIYDASGGEWFAVIDGTKYGPYASINRVYGIATEGEHFAFLAQEDDKEYAVFDGKKSDPWKSVQSICWVDGKPFYQVDQNSFVIDGKRTETYDRLHAFAFGKGGRFAFMADIGDRRHVIDGGIKGPAFSQDLHTVPVFSPDGSRLAYMVNDAGKCFIYVDGEKLGAEYDNLGFEMHFSPDGKRFAYSVIEKGKERWVVDGTKCPSGGESQGFAFSGDGAHYAHAAGKNGKAVTVFVDGVEVDTVAAVHGLMWSERLKCFAAMAVMGGEQQLLRIRP